MTNTSRFDLGAADRSMIPTPPVPTQLIVFADDWGRHPSSSQHLVRELLPQYPTLWVNTVGTRRPHSPPSLSNQADSSIGAFS